MAMNDVPGQAWAYTTVVLRVLLLAAVFCERQPATTAASLVPEHLPLTLQQAGVLCLAIRSGRPRARDYTQMGTLRLVAEHCDSRTATELIRTVRAYLLRDSEYEAL